MRPIDSFPTILPFPATTQVESSESAIAQTQVEVRPTACGLVPPQCELERISPDEIRRLRAKLLDMIMTNEQRRKLSRLRIAN